MKKITAIVLNYNGNKDTIECIASLKKSTTPHFEFNVVVVDNNSKTDISQQLQKSFPDVTFIKNTKNLGYSGGNNKGIEQALGNGADYILLLNNDTIVDKNLVEKLFTTAESEKTIGVVVPKIYFAKGFEYHKDRYKKDQLGRVIWYAGGIMDWKNVLGYHRGVDALDNGQYDTVCSVELASGNCMLIKEEVFEKIGFLNERYFLYYEDADFSMRVKSADYRIVFQPEAFLWHKNAVSAGGSGSSLQDYYISRNRLLFGFTYAPFRSKIAIIRESFSLIIKGRYWQKRGVIDFYLRKFYRGSYPV